MKMIHEAQPRPDDVCEIDGDQINDVSKLAKEASVNIYRPVILLLIFDDLAKFKSEILIKLK